jgi:hypothetical protein
LYTALPVIVSDVNVFQVSEGLDLASCFYRTSFQKSNYRDFTSTAEKYLANTTV